MTELATACVTDPDAPAGEATDRYEPLQLHGLSPKQVTAIGCLIFGMSDERTAERVGVHRVTVTRWRLYDETFRAAFADRLGEVWQDTLDHVRALVPRAVDTLHWALDCGDERTRVRAAIELLKLVARTHDKTSAPPMGPFSAGGFCPRPAPRPTIQRESRTARRRTGF